MKYRAIVSIEFDDDDLAELAETFGVDKVYAGDAITGEMDNLGFGVAWIEQLYCNGLPTVLRLNQGGLQITINDHDLDEVVATEDIDEDDDD